MEFPSLAAGIQWMRQSNPWVSDARLQKDAEDKMRQTEDGKWTWKADSSLFNIQLPDMTDESLISRYWNALIQLSHEFWTDLVLFLRSPCIYRRSILD